MTVSERMLLKKSFYGGKMNILGLYNGIWCTNIQCQMYILPTNVVYKTKIGISIHMNVYSGVISCGNKQTHILRSPDATMLFDYYKTDYFL